MYTCENTHPVNFLLWNTVEVYELQMRGIVSSSWDTPQCQAFMVSKLDAIFKGYNLTQLARDIAGKRKLGAYTFDPDVVVRRDEHGVLMGGSNWREFMETCLEQNPNLKRMSYDFGYFAHYDSLMVDIEDADGRTSLGLEWGTLAETVDWGSVPPYIQKYRTSVLQKLEEARNQPPVGGLPAGGYVVIWPQQYLHLLRPEFREELGDDESADMTRWIAAIARKIRALGLIPVVKASPTLPYSTSFHASEILKSCEVYVHCAEHAKQYAGCKFEAGVGVKLMAHAAFHVVLCSSVTNELTLAELPVVAMGRSWFNGLDIFYEPASWDALFEKAMVVNHSNRGKWANWWLTRQCQKDRICQKLVEVYRRHQNYI
jgi:hypothetical protein